VHQEEDANSRPKRGFDVVDNLKHVQPWHYRIPGTPR
jgi:hypothetical protein